jgi:hypothetical protein
MAGIDSDAPFQRIEELEQENEVLRDRLEEAEEDNERLRRENEELRKELKAAGRGTRRRRCQTKSNPRRPGRKAGQGRFTFRRAPAGGAEMQKRGGGLAGHAGVAVTRVGADPFEEAQHSAHVGHRGRAPKRIASRMFRGSWAQVHPVDQQASQQTLRADHLRPSKR